MYLIYLKSNGQITSRRKGEPEQAVLDKEPDCSLGAGIKWNNVNLFYAPDEEFPKDFMQTQGKYYVENDELKEVPDWEPEEEIWP